jgi:hypothetical protein
MFEKPSVFLASFGFVFGFVFALFFDRFADSKGFAWGFIGFVFVFFKGGRASRAEPGQALDPRRWARPVSHAFRLCSPFNCPLPFDFQPAAFDLACPCRMPRLEAALLGFGSGWRVSQGGREQGQIHCNELAYNVIRLREPNATFLGSAFGRFTHSKGLLGFGNSIEPEQSIDSK